MKIKITNKKSGLEVGKVFDLCDMSARNLINKGLAEIYVESEIKKPEMKEAKNVGNTRKSRR